MQASNVVRSLLLLCVCQSALASSPVNDYTHQVTYPPSNAAPGAPSIMGCMSSGSQDSSYSVSFYSLKTSGGSEYVSQLVTSADLACFENSLTKNLTAITGFQQCAEATAKEGLNSFKFEDDKCTAYLAWRPRVRSDCQDGGDLVMFVVKVPLTPFGGGAPNVSASVRYDNATHASLVITLEAETCGFADNKGFKLGWNTTEYAMVPEGVLEYILDRRLLCYISTNISLWSIGTNGEVNSVEAVIPIDRTEIYWYGLSTGGCIFCNGDAELERDPMIQFCKGIGASLFVEEVAGEFRAFGDALQAYIDTHEDDDVNCDYIMMGLTYNPGEDKWYWSNGRVQPRVGPGNVWRDPDQVDTASKLCANAVDYRQNGFRTWYLIHATCSTEELTCYDRTP